MGLSLRKLFKAREKPGEDVQRVSSVEIADQQVRDAVTEICLRELAFWTCVGKIANALTKCEFRTFYEMNIISGTTNRTATRTKQNFYQRPWSSYSGTMSF